MQHFTVHPIHNWWCHKQILCTWAVPLLHMYEITLTLLEKHICSNVRFACQVSTEEKGSWEWIDMYLDTWYTKISLPQYMLSRGALCLEKVRKPLVEHTKWSSKSCCPRSRVFPFRALALSGTGVCRVDFVSQWHACHIHKQHIWVGCIYQQRRKQIVYQRCQWKVSMEQMYHWDGQKVKTPDKQELLQGCQVLIWLICVI